MAQQDMLTTILALGGAYLFIDHGGKGTLPGGLQKLYNELLGTPTGGTPAPAGGSVPTASQIATWSANIGIQETCVGHAFVKQFGRLPNSIAELDTWGDSTGRHNAASGAWSCLSGD